MMVADNNNNNNGKRAQETKPNRTKRNVGKTFGARQRRRTEKFYYN